MGNKYDIAVNNGLLSKPKAQNNILNDPFSTTLFGGLWDKSQDQERFLLRGLDHIIFGPINRPDIKQDLLSGFRRKRLENGLELSIDIPGVKKETIELSVIDHMIKLVCKREEAVIERSCTLDNTVDSSTISATYEDGVLTLSMQFIPDSLPRKIDVK